jgi:hypothetical protein
MMIRGTWYKSTFAHEAVLVEVDRVENLILAYPNYFGDVKQFARHLRAIVHGKKIKDYTLAPQERVKPAPRELIDMSWMKRSHRLK